MCSEIWAPAPHWELKWHPHRRRERGTEQCGSPPNSYWWRLWQRSRPRNLWQLLADAKTNISTTCTRPRAILSMRKLWLFPMFRHTPGPVFVFICVLIHRWLLARVRILGILCLTWGAMEGLRNEWRSRLGSMPFHGLRTWSDRFQPMEQYLAVGRDYWSTHVVTLTLQLAWDQFQLSYNWTDISQRFNRTYIISTYVWVGV